MPAVLPNPIELRSKDLDIQKSVAIVSDFIVGTVLIVGSKNLALGMVDDTLLAILAGVIGVLMGLVLWAALYGTARNRPWSAMVRAPCYLVLIVLFSVALGGAVITRSITSPAEFWIGLGLWAVMAVNLSISVALLRRRAVR
jgi:hypothetical protein